MKRLGSDMTAEVNRQLVSSIKRLIHEDLSGHFGDAFEFGPVVVRELVDHDGDPYFRVDIVFRGDQEALDPDWTLGLTRRVLHRLRDEGMDADLAPHFSDRADWDWYREQVPIVEAG